MSELGFKPKGKGEEKVENTALNEGLWVNQVGKYVKIDTASHESYIGKLQSTDNKLTKLSPYFIGLNLGDTAICKVETKEAFPIVTSCINAVMPLPIEQGDLEIIVRYANQSKVIGG